MHVAGEEVVESGYHYVVTITNYHDETDPVRPFIRKSDYFKNEVSDVEQGSEQTWLVLKYSGKPASWHTVHNFRGYMCKFTVQDGELRGLGIYVFFKDKKGADECQHSYGDRAE